MQVLCRLVFAHSILIINLKLCSSKVYLKPDDAFGSDENNDLIIVLPNNLEPSDELNENLNEALQANNLAERDKSQETEKSDIDTQETDESDLNPRETDEIGIEIGDLNLNSAQTGMLRKRWHSKCDKKAAKTCRIACKNAYKVVCGSFKCKSRMKREFKKECKRNCKSKFVTSVSSIETE